MSSLRKTSQTIFEDDDPALTVQETSDQPIRNSSVSLSLKSEKISYICEMLMELRKLANSIDEPMVSYLIEMAYLEATTSQRIRDFTDEIGPKAK